MPIPPAPRKKKDFFISRVIYICFRVPSRCFCIPRARGCMGVPASPHLARLRQCYHLRRNIIIGKVYPIFGGILLFSAIGVFIGIFVKGFPLLNIWDDWSSPILTIASSDDTFTYANYFANGGQILVAMPMLSGRLA